MNISMPMWLFVIICLLLLNIGFFGGRVLADGVQGGFKVARL